MKKILLIIFLIIILLTTTGCDKRKNKDIDISSTTHYVDTTESVNIKTFNGFRLSNSELIKNENGSYRVVLDFKKMFE